MTLPKAIPTRVVNGFKFIQEIDFLEYKSRLPAAITPERHQEIPAENAAPRISRVVGFLSEIAQAQEILTSFLTNSVYVTGQEGVGKSALILGLLNKIALGDVAPALMAKSVFTFNLHEFFKLSPTDQVAQFDAAMDYMAKKNSLVIIDRIDDFVANCGPDRARRLMSSLINALENERVSALVTAQSQNHQSIESTSTLFSRYFKLLPVEERDSAEAKHILRQMAPNFESRHRVVIGDDVVSEIVRLDQRYAGRLKGQSPNRLVEFLDQLAASVNIAKYGKPVTLLKQEMELAELQTEGEMLKDSVKPNAVKIAEVTQKIAELQAIVQPQLDAWSEKFGKIRKTRESLLTANSKLAPLQEKLERYQAWKEEQELNRQRNATTDQAKTTVAESGNGPEPLTQAEANARDTYLKAEKTLRQQLIELEKGQYTETPHVTVADVQAKFTKITGLAAGGVTNDADYLLGIEKKLGENVFGQDRAKKVVANTYRMREAGTSDPTRPAGVVFLSGSTGCGKTELIERLAEIDGSELIVYNMSEYTDASSVSKLVGAAPGLVGFGDVKTLPSAVKDKPKSIVFFDEIEKAHPNMQRAIMQVMDKGKMKDEYGNSVAFKDCIIFMASNVLHARMFEGDEKNNDKIVRQKLVGAINPLTQQPYFLPEVVGRVDAVEVFDDVTPEIANMILHKNIRDISKGIAPRGYVIEMDQSTADEIIAAYFDASQGGRSIKQLSNKIIRPLTTERVLARQATETHEDGDALKPMKLTFDGNNVALDGYSAAETASDVPVPTRQTSAIAKGFMPAANAAVAGGPGS